MSIETELTRIEIAKQAIRSAIITKGVDVPVDAKINTYATYVSEIKGGGGGGDSDYYMPSTQVYNVPGWEDHQSGNWIYVKANKTFSVNYRMTSTSDPTQNFTISAGDEDTWINLDGQEFLNAKYINKQTASSAGLGVLIAMNLTLPNFIGTLSTNTSTAYNSIWRDTSLVHLKLTVDYFTGNLSYYLSGNNAMVSCELYQLHPNNSQISTMQYFFNNCYSLQAINLTGLKLTNLTGSINMSNLFINCYSLHDINIAGWDTSNFTNISGMFSGCKSLSKIDLKSWDVSKVTTFGSMFNKCNMLVDCDIEGWDTSSATNFSSMFSDCYSLTGIKGIEDIDVSKVTTFAQIFGNCYSMRKLDLSKWQVKQSGVTLTSFFSNCYSLFYLDLTSFPMSNPMSNCRNLQLLKMNNKGSKTSAFSTGSERYADETLIWWADHFPDITNDSSYTNTSITIPAANKNTWIYNNYFLPRMTAKGYTIS